MLHKNLARQKLVLLDIFVAVLLDNNLSPLSWSPYEKLSLQCLYIFIISIIYFFIMKL